MKNFPSFDDLPNHQRPAEQALKNRQQLLHAALVRFRAARLPYGGGQSRPKVVRVSPMPFKAAHVSFVSFAVEILSSTVTQVMIVETDLHLNPRHPSYNRSAVEDLISSARAYTSAHIEGPSSIRLVSTRSGEI
ncbi:hypothetical protein ABIB99_006513 [Bradyrhizobium sp. LA6.1]|uniref:hypothetical protein n=1 Tax=Bradyrhizobium sp. LA6.1 TaxID=3156378 RepID=UPI003392D782